MNPLFRDVLNMELFSDFAFIFPISSAKVHNITLLSIKNLKKQQNIQIMTNNAARSFY